MEDIEPVLTANALTVLNKRYLIKDATGAVVETPKQLFRRVAERIASVEDDDAGRNASEVVFYRMMARRDFMPNTPCLVNAGRPDGTGHLNACFVVPIEDDMGQIFEALRRAALIFKGGGGVGYSFSRIRPEDDFVHSSMGIASGPISFMKIFDYATEQIKQGGVRRGANMGILRCDHPDLMKFIELKSSDSSAMQNFNISVAITNEFMKALEENRDYDIVHPRTGEVCGKFNAPKVWKAITEHAWKIGDPGLWFIDRTNERDPLTELGLCEATNPCQPAWATVLTPDGIRTFADIDVGATIWSGQRWTKVVKKVATGVKPVYAYRTRAGTFYGTENHRVVQNGHKIEVRAADAIDAVVGPVCERRGYGLGDVVDGLVLGDGSYHKASGRVFLCAGPDDIKAYNQDPITSLGLIGEHRPGVKDTYYEVETSFKTLPLTYNRVVPDEYRYGDAVKVAGFLRGLYSANGAVVGNRVTLKAASFAVIEAVQEMLSSIGIASYYTTNKAHDVEHHNGVYTSRESYDLNIGNVEGRARFADLIGFIHKHKNERLAASLDMEMRRPPKGTYDIADIEYIGDEPVFDITVDADEHTYWTGGMLVSNCGEVPLRPLDACCLGSINLANFVDAIGRATPIVESTRLRITVRNAVRFLDNMLLASEYPLPEIADVTSKSRKIGLGVMGFAEMLIMLGIPYGSQAGRDFAKKLMADINGWAVQASEDLAIERGAFFHWDKSTYAKRGDKKRRNSTVTVIAPTGTISIIAGCSGGIEPLFALAITRNQAGTQMPEFNPLVEQIARREGFWQYEVSAAIADTGSIQGCAAVPEHWRNILRVASELTMEEHIGMQAAFQAHTEDGASKTINLRRDATVEDVDRAYRLAWASGCKGITVYRDGCRDKQVLTAGVAKPEASKPIAVEPAVFESFVPPIDKTLIGVQAPKWPTPSVTHRRVPSDGWRDGSTCTKPTSFGSVHVTINEHPSDAQPFEIFVRIGKGGSEIGAWTEALGRTGSFMLQLPSGSSPRDRLRKLGEQLADIGGGEVIGRGETKIVSAPDAISKIIYEYLQRTAPKAVAPDAKAETSSTIRRDFCPQCHKASLVRDGGCPYCPECSYSKC